MIPDGTSSVWAALPNPAILIDGADRISAMNPAAEHRLNLSGGAQTGKPIGDILDSDSELTQSFAHCRSGQTQVVHRDVVLDIRGRSLRCDVQIAPISAPRDHLLILLQARDVATQLGQAVQARSATRTAIGLSDLLAHEIKNPLAGIIGAAQLLSSTLETQDREMTDLIVAESQRILALVAQFDQFGDLRAPLLGPLNIHDILERAKASAAVGFAAHMRFVDDYDPSLPAVDGDEGQLLQVFSNLLRNAAQVAPDHGGTIRLHTYYQQGLRLRDANGRGAPIPLQVEIIDDGPGIPDDIKSAIFEPFVSRSPSGSGLGLALVSKIILAHGGAVSAVSRKGETVFKISLPLGRG